MTRYKDISYIEKIFSFLVLLFVCFIFYKTLQKHILEINIINKDYDTKTNIEYKNHLIFIKENDEKCINLGGTIKKTSTIFYDKGTCIFTKSGTLDIKKIEYYDLQYIN